MDLASIVTLKPTKIVLSPGPGHPSIGKDFGVCKEIILNAQKLACPILGVCLGHQGMVAHLGGKVIRAPQIVHGKSSLVKVEKENPLFAGLPDSFEAMRYHSLIACEESFPPLLEISAREGANGLIMALRHKELPMFGVQFHPESIGTPLGGKILQNFIDLN
jgi:anthranilate synthase/aminodeoxychorismate synthase-like glutamine amidotransferase